MSIADNQSSKIQNQDRVQRAIRKGLRYWHSMRVDSNASKKPSSLVEDRNREGKYSRDDVLTSIPRRSTETSPINDVTLPFVEPITFKTSRIKALGRVIVWIYMIASFVTGNFWDLLWRRDSEARRAVRLRRTFEKVGGTFIKFGQQMAMRIDLLPWAYTYELAKMLDWIPPFPLEDAIEIIERSTGKKWQDIFSVFDPEPVGSASVACVYQAILKNGDKVAVKVRRPKIGELFMADF